MSDDRRGWSSVVGTTWSGRFDFWVATLTAVTTAVTFALAILTPPRGGPFCIEKCVGYLLMAVAFLFAGLALSTPNRLYRVTRRVFLIGFTAVILLFVVFSIAYGVDVEYRFEVAAITVDWTVLVVAGTLLAFAYRSETNEPQQ